LDSWRSLASIAHLLLNELKEKKIEERPGTPSSIVLSSEIQMIFDGFKRHRGVPGVVLFFSFNSFHNKCVIEANECQEGRITQEGERRMSANERRFYIHVNLSYTRKKITKGNSLL